jgi:hypothetical protein
MNYPNSTVPRRSILATLAIAPAAAMIAGAPSVRAQTLPKEAATNKIRYRSQKVDEVEVYYREAGPADAPLSCFCTGSRRRATCFAT